MPIRILSSSFTQHPSLLEFRNVHTQEHPCKPAQKTLPVSCDKYASMHAATHITIRSKELVKRPVVVVGWKASHPHGAVALVCAVYVGWTTHTRAARTNRAAWATHARLPAELIQELAIVTIHSSKWVSFDFIVAYSSC